MTSESRAESARGTARERLNQQLRLDLEQRANLGLRRELSVSHSLGRLIERDGRAYLNLAGNDYLALAQDEHLKRAAAQALDNDGTGSGASRLVSGHLPIHHRLEERFARFKHAEAALLFPTGFMANLGVLTAMGRPGDLICQDKLNHASLIDAARASDAEARTYPHLGLDKLERLLARHAEASPESRRLIVTDSVFSMDGDVADLPALCDLADAYDAVLIIDEAHGTGVLGDTGAGLAERQGIAHRVAITISTASKALGGLGGIVTADRAVIDTLINHARSFIYTTAPPSPQAAAIEAALDVVRDQPERRQRLLSLCQTARQALSDAGWPGLMQDVPTPILPLIVGSVQRAQALADHLKQAGILSAAIRPPTVPPGSARIRLSLRADLTDADLAAVIDAVGSATAWTG